MFINLYLPVVHVVDMADLAAADTQSCFVTFAGPQFGSGTTGWCSATVTMERAGSPLEPWAGYRSCRAG